jgi:hypothetical protein
MLFKKTQLISKVTELQNKTHGTFARIFEQYITGKAPACYFMSTLRLSRHVFPHFTHNIDNGPIRRTYCYPIETAYSSVVLWHGATLKTAHSCSDLFKLNKHGNPYPCLCNAYNLPCTVPSLITVKQRTTVNML